MRSFRTAALLLVAFMLAAAIMIALSRPPLSTSASLSSQLVSSAWLAEHLKDRKLVVIHVGRDSTNYLAGHVPGARFLPISHVVTDRDGSANELPSVKELIAVFESLGISNDSRVVLYDDSRGLWAARAFFTLDYLGLGDQAALLDGGLDGWRQHGQFLELGVPPITIGSLDVTARPELVVDAEWVHERLEHPAVKLIDARPPAQYRGTEAGNAVERPGHIPGAVSFYWEEALVSEDNPTLRDLPALRAMLEQRGVAVGDTIVTYCRTGVQASHAYFVARLLDYPIKLYDPSFADWSNHTTFPVAR